MSPYLSLIRYHLILQCKSKRVWHQLPVLVNCITFNLFITPFHMSRSEEKRGRGSRVLRKQYFYFCNRKRYYGGGSQKRSYIHFTTQCAKDYGPHNHVYEYVQARALTSVLVFTQLKPYFKVCALIFFYISTCEESMKNSKNYSINIFDYEGHNPW